MRNTAGVSAYQRLERHASKQAVSHNMASEMRLRLSNQEVGFVDLSLWASFGCIKICEVMKSSAET